MNDEDALRAEARARGIAPGFYDIAGTWHEARPETLSRLIAAMDPPTGAPGAAHGADLAPAPPRGRCFLPEALAAGGRAWGLAVQLYGLTSRRNWGMGDFGDLRALVLLAAEAGAAAIQLNPLHALFPSRPDRISPYLPSSRLFLNPLYIAVEAVADFQESPKAQEAVAEASFQEALARLRAAALVDYAGVAKRKMAVLRLLYGHFRDRHLADPGSARARDFHDFTAEGGEALTDFVTFEALEAHFAAEGREAWPDWPAAYRDPRSDAVRRFAEANRDATRFHAYLQWVAARQLGAAAQLARARGMAVGLVADIAIGADAAGADTWRDQELTALDAQIGAPPDPFSREGQAWGAPPWRPQVLAARGCAPFAELLRAAMAWAGGVRLDHVIGLERQFWVPRGLTGRDGTYVAYPREALFAVTAAESRRHRCLVIGEDLGTVPEGFRDRMAGAHMLSTRVLLFERAADGRFRPPEAYPHLACAVAATHDLPTLAGFLAGRDIALRGEGEEAQAERRAAVAALREALAREGLLVSEGGPTPEPAPEAFIAAVHAYLARSRSALVLAQLEDVLGVTEQANLPGSTGEYPNWRRKYPLTLEEIGRGPLFSTLAETFRERAAPQPR